MDNRQPSFFNILLSTQGEKLEETKERKIGRKNSENSIRSNNKQSLPLIRQTYEHDEPVEQTLLKTVQSKTNVKKKASNAVKSLQEIEIRQNLSAEQKQSEFRKQYLENKINPVLKNMVVKIVNQKPSNLIQFMIEYLREHEDKYELKRFDDKAKNQASIQQKQLESFFDSTVKSKHEKFKKSKLT